MAKVESVGREQIKVVLHRELMRMRACDRPHLALRYTRVATAALGSKLTLSGHRRRRHGASPQGPVRIPAILDTQEIEVLFAVGTWTVAGGAPALIRQIMGLIVGNHMPLPPVAAHLSPRAMSAAPCPRVHVRAQNDSVHGRSQGLPRVAYLDTRVVAQGHGLA